MTQTLTAEALEALPPFSAVRVATGGGVTIAIRTADPDRRPWLADHEERWLTHDELAEHLKGRRGVTVVAPATPADDLADRVLGIPEDALARTWVQEPAVVDLWTIAEARGALRILTAREQELAAQGARLSEAADCIRQSLDVSTDR